MVVFSANNATNDKYTVTLNMTTLNTDKTAVLTTNFDVIETDT